MYIGKSVEPGLMGLHVGQFVFFSFQHDGTRYPCTLIQWFSTIGDKPCDQTGMWIVEPDFDCIGHQVLSLVHLDSLLQGAHLILIGVAGRDFIPIHNFDFSKSLECIQTILWK